MNLYKLCGVNQDECYNIEKDSVLNTNNAVRMLSDNVADDRNCVTFKNFDENGNCFLTTQTDKIYQVEKTQSKISLGECASLQTIEVPFSAKLITGGSVMVKAGIAIVTGLIGWLF